VVVFPGVHADQAGDLVFLGLRLMDAGATARLPCAQAPAIDLHDGYFRRRRHARLELALAPLLHLPVAPAR